MPFLALFPAAWKWVSGVLSALLSTEFGRLVLAALAALLIGDFHGANSVRVASEKAALEARIASQARDIRIASEIAELSKSQALDADAARADALKAIEEIKTHAGKCALSPADVDRLRRAGR